jgi:beta-galactosidase
MIAISEHKVIIGKEDYLPFSAEMHYFRVPKRYWSICFERMKRAGFKIISTVVPWNIHEDNNRDFDFSGFADASRDLIVFIELAREFGFKMILRPGPYINSEWDRNGLPEFLDKYPDIYALDSEGNYVKPITDDSKKLANFPSLSNPRYLNFVKHYLNGLTEIIKNYIYPRGPIFMIELGSDNFFGGNYDPKSADYNEYNLKTLYPEFLQEKYEDIKAFNKAYEIKLKDFEEISLQEELIAFPDKNLATKIDWLEFKDYIQVNYVNGLRDLYLSFSCNPLFLSTVSFRKNVQPPMNDFEVPEDEPKIMGVRLNWDDSSSDMLQKVRYTAANSDFPFVTELSIGVSSPEPEKSKNFFPVSDRATRYLITLAMAGGIKGFNASMFVERDHWYDAALANDGTIQPSYDVLKHFNAASMQVDFGAFDSVADVGVVSYRKHAYLDLLSRGSNFEYIENLIYSTLPGIGRDLDRLKIDFAIPELTNPGSLDKYKTLIVPTSEYMDAAEQELLVQKITDGLNVIFIGLVPRYNITGATCNILSSFLKLKSSASFEVGEIKYDSLAFPTLLYGTLNSSDSQAKTIAKAGKSAVAVKSNRYTGSVIYISFDLSTQYYHTKMGFLESLLADCNVSPFIFTSNPDVRAMVRTDKKRALLYLLYSRPQLPFKRSERHSQQIAIKVDLKRVGIKTAKLRMTELFSGEKELVTSRHLADGIITDLRSLDSRVWLIAPAQNNNPE